MRLLFPFLPFKGLGSDFRVLKPLPGALKTDLGLAVVQELVAVAPAAAASALYGYKGCSAPSKAEYWRLMDKTVSGFPEGSKYPNPEISGPKYCTYHGFQGLMP